MKRYFSLILIAALFASMTACQEVSSDAESTDGTTQTDSETTVDPLDDELPETDYGGYEFRFYTFGNFAAMYAPAAEKGDGYDESVS